MESMDKKSNGDMTGEELKEDFAEASTESDTLNARIQMERRERAAKLGCLYSEKREPHSCMIYKGGLAFPTRSAMTAFYRPHQHHLLCSAHTSVSPLCNCEPTNLLGADQHAVTRWCNSGAPVAPPCMSLGTHLCNGIDRSSSTASIKLPNLSVSGGACGQEPCAIQIEPSMRVNETRPLCSNCNKNFVSNSRDGFNNVDNAPVLSEESLSSKGFIQSNCGNLLPNRSQHIGHGSNSQKDDAALSQNRYFSNSSIQNVNNMDRGEHSSIINLSVGQKMQKNTNSQMIATLRRKVDKIKLIKSSSSTKISFKNLLVKRPSKNGPHEMLPSSQSQVCIPKTVFTNMFRDTKISKPNNGPATDKRKSRCYNGTIKHCAGETSSYTETSGNVVQSQCECSRATNSSDSVSKGVASASQACTHTASPSDMVQIADGISLSIASLAHFQELVTRAREVGVSPQNVLFQRLREMNVSMENSFIILNKFFGNNPAPGSNCPSLSLNRGIHTQVDYVHFLVPDLLQITNSTFYHGNMDRYRAEELLSKRPEGTFLLRDSAHTDHLFSVSFRRYGKSLHARIEQTHRMFCFDAHECGVFMSPTICGLLKRYSDPAVCRYFEPMLTQPLPRALPFSLTQLCRAKICSSSDYDGINKLALPKRLRNYLKEYHYKQLVCVRSLNDY